MFQLIYTSVPKIALSQDVLREIALNSRQKNESLGITGILMMANGVILQVLEGAETPVRDLYDAIQRDKRHTQFELLVARESRKREFEGWAMSFCEIGSGDADQVMEVLSLLRANSADRHEERRLAS